MALNGRLRSLASEDGVGMIVSIATLALMITLSSVAVWQAVAALRHTDRDVHVKHAGQAADAAIDAAIYSLDRLDLDGKLNIDPLDPTSVTRQLCVGVQDGQLQALDLAPTAVPDLEGRRWCPSVTEQGADGVTWSYQVTELARVGQGACGEERVLSLDRTVVAVGRSLTFKRRIKATLRSPITLLSGAAVQSGSTTSALTIDGAARILGDAHSNHDIVSTSGLPSIAGNATPGPASPNHTVSGPVVVTGARTAACQRFVLPPVSQGDAAGDNDNATITDDDLCLNHAAGMITVACDPPSLLLPRTGDTTWSGTNNGRTLTLTGNSRVVLGQDTYALCRLELHEQATLIIPASAPITRIFLDDPGSSHCSGVAGAGQIVMDGSARIVNCHLATDPGSLQLYGVGSASAATTQTLAGGGPLSAAHMATLCATTLPVGGTPMVLYAPRSQITLRGSTQLTGQVAGDRVALNDLAAVQPAASAVNLNALGPGPVLPLYEPADYVECTPMTFEELGTNPTQGC